FRLTMSRRDIASYLGLASETVSRIMTRFNKEGLINTRGKRTRVIDLKHLQEIAENA
ncbi:MAG TPA: Crp/Fnr family transcriptional regulator, partial [Chromatiales bacterium]|nr:Crp/Fnr family transcriptional regulator [Chromatiales bacterium]